MYSNRPENARISEFHVNPEKCNECNGEDLIEDKKRLMDVIELLENKN